MSDLADISSVYHKWLGIPPKDQPPNHYRLLAVELFESDPDVIDNAADQRLSHVRRFQIGANSALSQRILNEIAAARICLLNPAKKAAYDAELRQSLTPPAADTASPSTHQAPLAAGPAIPIGQPMLPAVQPATPIAPLSQPALEPATPHVATNIPRRSGAGRRDKRNPVASVAKTVLGGIAGLSLAYVVLCLISPANDFLNIWPAPQLAGPSSSPTPPASPSPTPDSASQRDVPNRNREVEPTKPSPSEQRGERDPNRLAGTTGIRPMPNGEPAGNDLPTTSVPEVTTLPPGETPTANATQPGTITIVSSTFGEGAGRANTTQLVQRLVDEAAEVEISTPGLGLRNPSGQARRYLVIHYRIDNEDRRLQLPNGARVNLREEILDHFLHSLPLTSEPDETAASPTDPPPPKAPAPDSEALAKAAEEVRVTFQPELQQASTEAEKSELARRMIAAGVESQDLATRHALLTAAGKLATSIADVATAFTAAEALDATFEGDLLGVKASVLLVVAEQTRPTKEFERIAELFAEVIDEAVSQDRFDVAQTLAEPAVATARKSRNTDQMRGSVQRRNRVQELAEAYAGVPAALAALETDPTDAEANLAAGKYFCFFRADWVRGLPLLALGSDGRLRKLANQEAEEEITPLSLGDDWWAIAEQLTGLASVNVKVHAAEWYETALADLSEPEKLVVQERLAEAQRLTADTLSTPAGALLIMTFDQGTIVSRGGKSFVNDLSGKGNHGELHGAVPTPGVAGNGLLFDGKKDFIHLPSLRNHLIQDLPGITISAWIRSMDKPVGVVFDVGSHPATSIGFQTTLREPWKEAGYFVLPHAAGGAGTGFSLPLDNRWRHVAGTWADRQQCVYLDGELMQEATTGDFVLNSRTVGTDSARIGSQAKRGGEHRFFAGAIDEFAIFDRGLSAEEIQTLYRMGQAGKSLAK